MENIQCDNVGICHYRRYFVQDELLTIEYMEECLKTYDIIVPDSGMTMYENVYKHYENRHKIKDLNICGEVLLQKYPKDYAAFKWSLERNFMSLGNMVITSKTLYDEYCSWLFDILFEVEKELILKTMMIIRNVYLVFVRTIISDLVIKQAVEG